MHNNYSKLGQCCCNHILFLSHDMTIYLGFKHIVLHNSITIIVNSSPHVL